MKKLSCIIFILLISANSFAQIDKITGDWELIRYIRIDTLTSGRDEIDKDYKAYSNGYKILDPEMYTSSYYIVPEENDKLNLNIIKEDAYFWASDSTKFKEKITYKPDFAAYFITINKFVGRYSCIVEYEVETDKLLFLDYRSKDVFYEFKRKK